MCRFWSFSLSSVIHNFILLFGHGYSLCFQLFSTASEGKNSSLIYPYATAFFPNIQKHLEFLNICKYIMRLKAPLNLNGEQNIEKQGLERWPRNSESLLLFQRTYVRFLAHTMELQPSVILVLNEDYHLLISLSTRHSCDTQTYIQTNTLNTKKIFLKDIEL